MHATAAVINAGLGDISLGLEMAGFKVVAAYEADEKALMIHRTNIKAPTYRIIPEELEVKSFPEVDLLAARIYCSPSFPLVRTPYAGWSPLIHKLCEILSVRRPRGFFLLFNASFVRDKRFQMCVDEILKTGYQYVWKTIDVAQATGLPVSERMVCMVGTRQSMEKPFQFPEYHVSTQMQSENYLQLDQAVDSWYFRVKPGDVSQHKEGERFYCWKNGAYMAADFVQWNFMKVPLVRIGEECRKITHREIVNLKSFPEYYTLPDNFNKQWLYQKLMYSSNVLVVKQIAGRLSYALTDNPWRSQQAERGIQLESLFGRYLENLKNKGLAKLEPLIKTQAADFVILQGNKKLFFEVRYYNGSFAPESKVRVACEKLSSLKADGMPILVLANEVPEQVKLQYWERFGVSIWDVGNLLWLFDEFADIKNEFIASLDYAIEHIKPMLPVPDVFHSIPEGKKEEPNWKERLLHIEPGREQFQQYESICTDILKYVLGDYLTLWETQEPSNDGLYRFDLCCKIKNGANQDFFDTIKHYFNTKYIVFEFKNYSKKISQKEIYTTEKYLYEKALRKVAIIVSRRGADEHALQAIRGSLRETGKLILCLSDNELLEMIDIKMREEQAPAEFLSALLDDLLVHLEK